MDFIFFTRLNLNIHCELHGVRLKMKQTKRVEGFGRQPEQRKSDSSGPYLIFTASIPQRDPSQIPNLSEDGVILMTLLAY